MQKTPRDELHAHSIGDLFSIACSVLIVVVLLIYCGWRVIVADENIRKHRAYIEGELEARQKYVVDRDARWEEIYRAHVKKQDEALAMEKSIIERLDRLEALSAGKLNAKSSNGSRW